MMNIPSFLENEVSSKLKEINNRYSEGQIIHSVDSTGQYEELFSQAEYFYGQKQYKNALQCLNKSWLLHNAFDNLKCGALMGLIYIETNNYPKAKDILTSVIAQAYGYFDSLTDNDRDMNQILKVAIAESLNAIGIFYRKKAVYTSENGKDIFKRDQQTVDCLLKSKECFIKATENDPYPAYEENYEFVTGILNKLMES
jgi:hypothetical protein